MILCRGTHGEFESTLSVRCRLKLCQSFNEVLILPRVFCTKCIFFTFTFPCENSNSFGGGGGGGGCDCLRGSGFGFGSTVSPNTMFTKQYSISAINTKIVQTDMNASTAFKYETGGSDACDLACWVDSVSNEVTPNVTRAGAASGFIQNDTHWKNER